MHHGCTLSTLFIDATKMMFYFTNVGDTIGIRISGITDEYMMLGELHTRRNKSETTRVKQNGGQAIGKRWFQYHIGKHTYSSQLSRSFGHVGNPAITQTPTVQKGPYVKGDKFLVATDGLWDYVSHKEAAQILRDSDTLRDVSQKLLQMTQVRSRPNKRKDNLTIVCVSTAEEKKTRTNLKKLGCLFEAFIGALFLDFNKIDIKDEHGWFENIFVCGPGFQMAQIFIENIFERHVDWVKLIKTDDNYKNILQVKIQKEFKITPDYIEVAHNPDIGYTMGVYICIGISIHDVSNEEAGSFS